MPRHQHADPDISDASRDPGREESQTILHTKMTGRYLDEVLAQAESDVADILHTIASQKEEARTSKTAYPAALPPAPAPDSSSAETTAALLASADALVQAHKQANDAISASFPADASANASGSDGRAVGDLELARERDRERVRDLLKVGLGVCRREEDGLDVDGELAEQGRAVFGIGGEGAADGIEEVVVGLERGIRRMGKGVGA